MKILARPEYVGADETVIANTMTGTFEYEKGDKRPVPDFNVFFRYHATYPYYSDAIWYLTQMRRWGQITEHKPDSWYLETAKKVYRPDIYVAAAKELIADGSDEGLGLPGPRQRDGYQGTAGRTSSTASSTTARKPNAYIDSFTIGLKGSAQP